MNKLFEKLIAVMLVIVLAGANLSILGMYGISYALTDAELAGQTTATGNSNVEFNAYFQGGGHTEKNKYDATTKLFVNVKVKNAGYLKNAQISFDNVNFKIAGNIENSNVQSVNKESNIIALKQLNNGSDVTIEVPVSILESDTVSSDFFAKETKAIFQGTYVDANGKEKSVSKEIVNKLTWELGEQLKDVTNVDSEVINCAIYPDRPRILVQIRTKISYGKLPIKGNKILVMLPDILGTPAKEVAVVANSTEATNGDKEGLNFGTDNYTYDQEQGKVSITVNNGDNIINWSKDKEDEYIITCVYRSDEISDAIDKSQGLPTNFAYDVNVQVSEYEDIKTSATAIWKYTTPKDSITLKEGASLIKAEVSGIESISKGQIYANYSASEADRKETAYWTRYGVTVYESQATRGELKITQNIDNLQISGSSSSYPTTVSKSNYTYNKTVKVSESSFKKLLGEDGTIDICNVDGTKFATINKDTNKDSDGNYVVDISSANNNQLMLIAYAPNKLGTGSRGPIGEGKLVIYIEKAFKTNQDYTLDQMKTFTSMKAGVSCTSTYLDSKQDGTHYTDTASATLNIPLTEAKSVVELSVNKKDLSTVVKNENVEIRATLDTSSISNALYTNPTLKIKLPSYIKKVDLKSSNILMANGLKLKDPTITTENGAQVINVVLEGTQTEYTIDAEYKGTIVILNTDLTVDTLTPSNSNKIVMDFTNANTATITKSGSVSASVNFVAPNGVVAANGISNYAEGKNDILSISDEGVTGTIATYADARTAKINGTVINNYSNKISNVIILGRIPTKDNKNIDTAKALGSTFSTTLKTNVTLSGIDSSKYKVYYSENADATNDLSNTANGWTETATTGAKSYLIVTNGYEMDAGGIIKFSYDVEIPANLTHNNDVYEMYKVYYNNVSSIGTMAETKTSAIAGMSTGKGAILSAELSAVLPEGTTTVREGQTVKMKVVVKNTGTMTANNVKVKVEKTTGIESVIGNSTIDIGSIEVGKSAEATYSIKLGSGDVISKVTVTADGIQDGISSNEYKFSNVEKSNFELNVESSTLEEYVLNTGMELTHIISVYTKEEMNNVVVRIPLAKGIEYKGISIRDFSSVDDETNKYNIVYDENSNIVTITFGTGRPEKIIELKTKVKDTENKVSYYIEALADGIPVEYSNIMTYATEKVKLEISELTSTPKYVKEKNDIVYSISIKNTGNAVARFIKLSDSLPSELKFVDATYVYANEEQKVTNSDNNKIDFTINQIAVGETITIKLTAKANLLSDKNDKEVKNKISVSAKGFDAVETNTVTNIIEYDEDAHKEDNGEDNNDPTKPTEKRYKITGTAWVDSNKNGKRDTDEELLSGIKVMLLNKKDNSTVKDVDSKKDKITTTNSSGKYEFSNLQQGEYIVIFLYDSGRYSLTTYKQKDVDSSLNSDVIDINATISGKRTIVASTDAITITNDNVRDIDIGVYSAEKFDLKLDKYISKITLTTPTIGTRPYDYDNAKIGKIEVLGSNLGKSSAVIEYKIVVTNEGAIPGYVKKIVDYLPQGIGFNTELNKDWYLSDNGNVYNASLANTIINPGESKEVTLVLTKKITEDSLGLINNNAEIYESYNEQGAKDIDSTEGNKVTEEDDMSSADVMVSIVTGKIITYTTITLGVITLLGFGVYEIKKRVLNKKNI